MTDTHCEMPLIGDSAPIRRLRALVARVAPTRMPVLIEGATGTGKELVATMLHRMSGRAGSFVPFNVCALGESMFEDALFGHARGAYTGAMSDSPGYLREANGGTVFLDEISGLALGLQSKLLRAIETGVFRPIGASRDVRSEFRTVVATNEPLDALVTSGRFRADLAHRLCGIVLLVPTLDERPDDIPILVEHFAKHVRPQEPVTVSPAAIDLLSRRSWPGNVRELRQVVEAAVVFGANVVDAETVELVLTNRSGRVSTTSPDEAMAERAVLLSSLEGADWDVDRLAVQLDLHRSTIYRRLKRLGIVVGPGQRRSGYPVALRRATFASVGATMRLAEE